MWLMGCSDAADYIKHDSFAATRLRPLVPRSMEKPHVDFVSQSPSAVGSSRWNPTPEQLRILEELYRRGTRTPSADQIQNITAQLCRYGKIEGKNVFYWFQNHKARERQKRRRQMDYSLHPQTVPQFLRFSVSVEDAPITTAKTGGAEVNDGDQSHLHVCSKGSPVMEATAINAAKRRVEEDGGAMNVDGEGEELRIRTLQLFPVKNSINCKERDRSANGSEASEGAETKSNIASCRFYQFLPLKN